MNNEDESESFYYTSEFYWSVRKNAKRLINDARMMKLLMRYPSAVACAILALEELGKSLILRWNVRNLASKRKFPTHIEKQSATFALLSATEIIKGGIANKIANGDLNKKSFHAFGPYSSQFAYARAGFYENLRKSVVYADEEPVFETEIIAPHIKGNLVKELIGFFVKADTATKSNNCMKLAATIYSLDLGRM